MFMTAKMMKGMKMSKTATVIDLAAVLNARRVATKQAEAAAIQAKQGRGAPTSCWRIKTFHPGVGC
jgi:hypothetical protein